MEPKIGPRQPQNLRILYQYTICTPLSYIGAYPPVRHPLPSPNQNRPAAETATRESHRAFYKRVACQSWRPALELSARDNDFPVVPCFFGCHPRTDEMDVCASEQPYLPVRSDPDRPKGAKTPAFRRAAVYAPRWARFLGSIVGCAGGSNTSPRTCRAVAIFSISGESCVNQPIGKDRDWTRFEWRPDTH